MAKKLKLAAAWQRLRGTYLVHDTVCIARNMSTQTAARRTSVHSPEDVAPSPASGVGVKLVKSKSELAGARPSLPCPFGKHDVTRRGFQVVDAQLTLLSNDQPKSRSNGSRTAVTGTTALALQLCPRTDCRYMSARTLYEGAARPMRCTFAARHRPHRRELTLKSGHVIQHTAIDVQDSIHRGQEQATTRFKDGEDWDGTW